MKQWFNSPYYHILYKNRDDDEARYFIDNLVRRLNLKSDTSILDLACGKGRHATYLNKLGFDVVGLDYSKENIKQAKVNETQSLKFYEHDIRTPFDQTFDLVLNLFTSFGYSPSISDDIEVLKSMKKTMRPNAMGVIDFLNASYTVNKLIPKDIKVIDGIRFLIHKKIVDNRVVKTISFEDGGQSYQFEETVRLITKDVFRVMFQKVGLNLIDAFGNYALSEFDASTSERLILYFTR